MVSWEVWPPSPPKSVKSVKPPSEPALRFICVLSPRYCENPEASRPPDDLLPVEAASISADDCGGLVVRDAEMRGSPEGVV